VNCEREREILSYDEPRDGKARLGIGIRRRRVLRRGIVGIEMELRFLVNVVRYLTYPVQLGLSLSLLFT